jgi:hypothetical protein
LAVDTRDVLLLDCSSAALQGERNDMIDCWKSERCRGTEYKIGGGEWITGPHVFLFLLWSAVKPKELSA